ncbi:MAG: hypothetical protein HOV80_00665 [Polyangiaceae bacterium]|nr:hypothetical protein [Polyangiaceae bacterium]
MCVFVAIPAFAQSEPLPGDRAVALAKEGLKHYEAGAWAEAFEKFRAADEALHSPVFRLYMARAKRTLSKLLEARVVSRELVSEKLRDDASPTFKQAQVDGKAELTSLEASIPSIVVNAPGAGANAALSIDGKPAFLGQPIELDPGEHDLKITDGARTASKKLTARAGERDVAVEMTFSSDTSGPGPGPGPGGPGDTTPKDATATEGSIVPGVVLIAIGGASLIAGGVLGGLALAMDGDITESCTASGCTDGRTADDLKSDQDTSLAMAHASTGTLIGGGVLAAVGVVLVIVRPGGSDTAPKVTVGPAGARAIWSF